MSEKVFVTKKKESSQGPIKPEDLIVLKSVIAVQKDRTQMMLNTFSSP